MAKQRMWVLLVGADNRWHTRGVNNQSRTRCGLACTSVRRVTTSEPQRASACETCLVSPVPSANSAQAQKQVVVSKKLSKAVVKKMEELRSQGVRAELLEALAIDALSRSPGRSVRTVNGGLPSLGRRSK